MGQLYRRKGDCSYGRQTVHRAALCWCICFVRVMLVGVDFGFFRLYNEIKQSGDVSPAQRCAIFNSQGDGFFAVHIKQVCITSL
jgi:hypothetical protein